MEKEGDKIIHTSFYKSPKIDPAKQFLVSASLWSPRFRLPYKIDMSAPMLAPTSEMLTRGYSGIEYWDLLDARQAGVIRTLNEAEELAGGRDIVLLCFCDTPPIIVTGGKWCHRHVFASWWRVRVGEEVTEL